MLRNEALALMSDPTATPQQRREARHKVADIIEGQVKLYAAMIDEMQSQNRVLARLRNPQGATAGELELAQDMAQVFILAQNIVHGLLVDLAQNAGLSITKLKAMRDV